MMDMLETVVFASLPLFAVAGFVIGRSKGMAVEGTLMCLLLGPIGLIWTWMMHPDHLRSLAFIRKVLIGLIVLLAFLIVLGLLLPAG